MKPVRKTYVRFRCNEMRFFDEYIVRLVRNRDPKKLKVPKTAYAFSFFDVISVAVDVEGKKIRLESGSVNHSTEHFCGGKVYTVTEIQRKFKADERVLTMVRFEDSRKKFILCRTDNWQRFVRGDVFVKETRG